MSERLFARLASWLASGPVVLASVLDTRGATPRKRGARMLITANASDASIGGGQAEAQVIEAARAMLPSATHPASATPAAAASHEGTALTIELDGRPGAAGVCGGRMQIALRRWNGAADQRRAQVLASALASGCSVALTADDIGASTHAVVVQPDPRLLIVGGGHCGHALFQLARYLDFDVWVFDSRSECFDDGRYAGATVLTGEHTQLATALDTQRPLLAILLNRDFHADVRTLQVLAQQPPAFLGMMGSQRRIHEVLAALPAERASLVGLQAPVGLQLGAQTPHEIAISILAQLVQWQHQADATDTG